MHLPCCGSPHQRSQDRITDIGRGQPATWDHRHRKRAACNMGSWTSEEGSLHHRTVDVDTAEAQSWHMSRAGSRRCQRNRAEQSAGNRERGQNLVPQR